MVAGLERRDAGADLEDAGVRALLPALRSVELLDLREGARVAVEQEAGLVVSGQAGESGHRGDQIGQQFPPDRHHRVSAGQLAKFFTPRTNGHAQPPKAR